MVVWFTYRDFVFLLALFLMTFLVVSAVTRWFYGWLLDLILLFFLYIFIDLVVFYLFLNFVEDVSPGSKADFLIVTGPMSLFLFVFAFLLAYHDVLFSKKKLSKFKHELIMVIPDFSLFYNGVCMPFFRYLLSTKAN